MPTLPATGIVAGPSGINVDVGNNVQIGVLDPGKFPLTVTGTNGLSLASILGSVSNLVDGVLTPTTGGVASLDLNGVTGSTLLSALVGTSGSTLKICAQGTTNCSTVNLIANPAGLALSSSLASIALQPGTSTPLTITALPLLGSGPFTAVSSNANVLVTSTGLGTFTVAAAVGVGVPTSATITVTDADHHTLTIPVTVF